MTTQSTYLKVYTGSKQHLSLHVVHMTEATDRQLVEVGEQAGRVQASLGEALDALTALRDDAMDADPEMLIEFLTKIADMTEGWQEEIFAIGKELERKL